MNGEVFLSVTLALTLSLPLPILGEEGWGGSLQEALRPSSLAFNKIFDSNRLRSH